MTRITSNHFGLNFVADYEAIGDKPWEKFDEIVERTGILNLRYPGGISAETILDIYAPDASFRLNEDGTTKLMTPMSDFFDACARLGAQPTIIIPTFSLASAIRADGHRTFDPIHQDALATFILQALTQTPKGSTLSFEIGNEYAAELSAVEYGRIAAVIAKTIQNVEQSLTNPPPTTVYV